jgi:hypothetical protein
MSIGKNFIIRNFLFDICFLLAVYVLSQALVEIIWQDP